MFRYQGTARATGAFRLVPATRLWVGPATLRFASGSVVTGPYDLVTNIEGAVDCTVHDFDVQGDALPFISMKILLANDLPALRALSFVSPGLAPLGDQGRQWNARCRCRIRGRCVRSGKPAGLSHRSRRNDDRRSRLSRRRRARGPSGCAGCDPHWISPAAHTRRAHEVRGARYAPMQVRNVDALVATSTLDVTRHWSFAGGRAMAALTLRESTGSPRPSGTERSHDGDRGGPRRDSRHGDDVT